MSDVPTGNDAGDPLDDEIEVDLEGEDSENPEDAEVEEGGDDAASDDAEGEGDDGGPPQQGQARDVGRGRARGRPNGEVIRSLESENRELKSRITTFEQQLQGLINERRQPSAAEIAAQQEAERQHFEMLSPYEQHQWTQRKIAEEVERRTNGIAINLWDQNDRRDYESLLQSNPAYRRLDDKVEELRRQAPQVARRILLATAIGMAALERGGAARTRAARNSEANGQRHQARPSNGRGDVAAPRGRQGDSLDERLRNAAI